MDQSHRVKFRYQMATNLYIILKWEFLQNEYLYCGYFPEEIFRDLYREITRPAIYFLVDS
ncbi:hypothetical protein OUZ56_011602 [Daphnia magna]|uniref:Uncharacterized protein n=1 Tax=Daphnia magna TaxID=35525 RepID=A0ABQ9Z0P0_9CRUS|nr:hypothetical protein OUZ56_011602 [Daphnia magna]